MPASPIRFDEPFRADQVAAARRAMFAAGTAEEQREATLERAAGLACAAAFLLDVVFTLATAGQRPAAMEAYRQAAAILGS